jgi:hypothetical protein
MPKSIVDRVNFISRDQPIQPMFLDPAGNPIGDRDANYEEDPAKPTTNLPGEVIPEVATDQHVKITGVDDVENAEPIKFQADSTSSVGIPGVDTAQQRIEINDLNLSLPQEPALIEPAKPEQPRQLGRERKAMQKYAPSMSGKSYAYTQLGFLFLQDTWYKYSSEVVEMVMTQLSLKAALKQWGEDAKVAVEAKAKQLHWRNSFKPVHWKDVDEERRKQIFESHVLMKKKRTSPIKARKVAGGNKQRDFISKENVSSPTIAMESVLLLLWLMHRKTVTLPLWISQTRSFRQWWKTMRTKLL